ncbi:helicase-related protein [Mycolicibacterium neworleansense]|uniref:Helicase domain-containing protein n=1 Tax=Mycolicibacterium neworleansense TaxID=146018 RepID=A0A0H5RSN5_9MYCO|nr:helicase-related protein [Mycolicibacterium neworleansense]CRZ16948.1 helicase domain-containing protein [Mycolicibacterium neworleansense]
MSFAPGALVTARGRDWVVQPDSSEDFLVLRPLGGRDDDIAGVFLSEGVQSATFPAPSPDDLGDHHSATLLRDAVKVGFRSTTGPFRCLASINVEPRAYQLVPLMMALRQDVVRLLISDDVGIGKTVEAALIAAELLETGAAQGLAVLCSPALAEQWQTELRHKFGIEAELVLSSTVTRLERGLIGTESLFDRYRHVVVSTDFIKSPRHRHEFLRTCPDLVIVDEVHTCVAASGLSRSGRTLRYDLVRDLADDPRRHLILVSATPHSGKDETFENLIKLLDKGFNLAELDTAKGREKLARHFVQRRRGDIRKYLDQETPFPKERKAAEIAYALSPEYRALFDQVLDYARETVRTGDGGVARRVNWWSALALLRALASSPRAAVQTLRTRAAALEAQNLADADRIGRAAVLDLPDLDTLESADSTPGADSGSPLARRLTVFRKAAQMLEDKDTKAAELVKVVKKLLADDYNPIVFCRFIDTAEYVAEVLSAKLGRKVMVQAVTGTLPPEERIARIDELTAIEGHHVLVATDCLAEGVNLQNDFQAVVHYDLAWNPTRHEQREGRVDRFGQQHDVVRAVTLYGKDNHIDGIVLEVLLRKHERIRNATGVSVPVPDNSDAVVEALMEGLLLRGTAAEQLSLDLEVSQQRDSLYAEWDSAAQRETEKQSMTKYAQAAIKETEVQTELDDARAGLGSHAEVKDLTRTALAELGSTIVDRADGFEATTGSLPLGLRNALPLGKSDPLFFADDLPAGRGDAVLLRTDETVAAVADYVLQSALDPMLPAKHRPARRCAVIRTRDVSKRTALLLVRYRFHMELPSRTGLRRLVAEDLLPLAYVGSPANPQWLDDPEELFAAAPSQNIPEQQARSAAARTLSELDQLSAHLVKVGERLASDTYESHRRVRQAGQELVRGLKVTAEPNADILGVYIYLPEVVA